MGKHKDKSRKHKKSKKHKKKERRSSSSSNSSDEWVEKTAVSSPDRPIHDAKHDRDEWMSLPSSFHTTSKHDKIMKRENERKLDRELNKYDPSKSSRELNPYWKGGGSGLPTFAKPSDNDNFQYKAKKSSSNWKKVESTESQSTPIQAAASDEVSKPNLNILASKLFKAELMGNTDLVNELKSKLEEARAETATTSKYTDDVVLTMDDKYGTSRPLHIKSQGDNESGSSRKKRKAETHVNRERVKYFADDDKYSLKQMFENEKYESAHDQHKEFLKIASKAKTDLDDFFTDEISKSTSDEKLEKKNVAKAIHAHIELNKALDTCNYCLQSDTMVKHLMVSLGETIYLSVPSFEEITENQCLLIPLRHVSCATNLEENEWDELLTFRKSICNMFNSFNKDVIFFETALHIHRRPHMVLHCVPLDQEQVDVAPMYFKKAIDESETEWSTNKKLVSLSGRDVRKAIPKGLPYFSVSFGMKEGYAHVIEDEKLFPRNFAQEIIGGMLDLHHSKWRKPQRQTFEQQSKKVQNLTKIWSSFDCTK